jgi:hypothetical protein
MPSGAEGLKGKRDGRQKRLETLCPPLEMMPEDNNNKKKGGRGELLVRYIAPYQK